MGPDGLDQFGLLEEMIQSLITMVCSLQEEKIAAEQKLQSQKEKIESLTEEIEKLNVNKKLARTKVVALVEKLEAFNV